MDEKSVSPAQTYTNKQVTDHKGLKRDTLGLK